MNQKPTKLQYEFHNNYHSLCELLMALGYDTKISKNTIFVNKFGYVFSISSIGTAPRNAKFIVIHSGIDNSKFHIQINKKSELDIEKAKKIIDTLLLRDLKSFMINLFSIKMREIQPEFVPRIYGYDVFVNKPVPQVCIKHKVKFEPENGFKFITELVTINMIPNENSTQADVLNVVKNFTNIYDNAYRHWVEVFNKVEKVVLESQKKSQESFKNA